MQKTSSPQTNSTGEGLLELIEVDESGIETGRRAAFTEVEFKPLSYSDLNGKKMRDKVIISLRLSAAKLSESTLPDLMSDQITTITTTVESEYSQKTIGLVKGGWLPSGLALRAGMIVLPDRCTVTELATRFKNGVKTKKNDLDFLDLFQDKQVRINPSLFALEGNLRQRPTTQEVANQWAEASRKIKAALPNAIITPEEAIQGLVGLLEDLQSGMANKTQFLLEVMSAIRSPVSAKARPGAWTTILKIAKGCDVPRHSLVVLAALSVLCNGNDPAASKRLLKPSPNYTSRDAYNALADLQALEVLIMLYAAFPNEKIMLCTGDKNLALFWAGIRASNFQLVDQHISYTVSPIDALLPNVSPDLLEIYLSTGQPNEAHDCE